MAGGKVGGGGLNAVSVMLIEKELGRTSLALAECAHRPLNILAACEGEQIKQFLEPTIRGEKRDCIAMTEPGAGSNDASPPGAPGEFELGQAHSRGVFSSAACSDAAARCASCNA